MAIRGRQGWWPPLAPIAPDAALLPAVTDEVRVTQFSIAVCVPETDDVPDPVEDPDGDGEVDPGTNPAADGTICGAEVPVAKDEIEYGDNVLRYAKLPINLGDDPVTPRVASFGPVRRSLSNDFAEVRGTTVNSTLIDTDGVLRTAEDSDSLIGCRYSRYVSSEARLRVDPTDWQRVFDGIIADTDPLGGRLFGIQAIDYLSKLLEEFAKKTFPQRLFSLDDFPNMGNRTDDPVSPGNPTMLGKPVPIGYGMLSDEATTRLGVVPFVYTGQRAIAYYNGAPWHEYVAFGHAPGGNVQSLFIPEGPGLSTGTSYPSRVAITGASPAVEYLFPGTAAWTAAFGAAPYQEFNGNRYAVVYGFGPRSEINRTGQVPLVANWPGIEDVGDGTGNVITALRRQILHLWINWILQSYTSGAWLGIPSVGAGADLYSRIDTTTFENLLTIDGAFILGAGGRAWTLDELMNATAKNLHFEYGENRHGQIIASRQDPTQAINRALTAFAHTIQGTYHAKRRRDLVKNTVTYRSGRRYVPPLAGWTPAAGELLPTTTTEQNTDWLVEGTPLVDVASVTKYGERIENIDFDFVRDAAAADQVAQLVLDESAVAPVLATHTEGACGTETDLGDVDTLVHFDALSETARRERCEVHELDVDDWTVEKTYRERAAS